VAKVAEHLPSIVTNNPSKVDIIYLNKIYHMNTPKLQERRIQKGILCYDSLKNF
jgi:hypothetical protein